MLGGKLSRITKDVMRCVASIEYCDKWVQHGNQIFQRGSDKSPAHGAPSVSVSLSLSDEPSHESRNASTSKQNCTRSTLPAAEAQQQVAPRLWIPALASMCLLVQSAALFPAGSSIVQLRVGCTAHQVSQQLGAFATCCGSSPCERNHEGVEFEVRVECAEEVKQGGNNNDCA